MSATDITGAVETGSISTEKTTVRAYVKLNEKGELAEKPVAKAESAARGKDEKGNVNPEIAANWQKLEASGYQQLNENDIVRYSVKDMAGFTTLIPDPEQQVYLINCGINYVQNSKSNALAVELKEGTGGEGQPMAEPVYNGETLDMREYLNESPKKRALSPMDKLLRTISGLGMDQESVNALLLEVAKRQAAQQSSAGAQLTAGPTEETEEVNSLTS